LHAQFFIVAGLHHTSVEGHENSVTFAHTLDIEKLLLKSLPRGDLGLGENIGADKVADAPVDSPLSLLL
jgi:hypothetical protein